MDSQKVSRKYVLQRSKLICDPSKTRKRYFPPLTLAEKFWGRMIASILMICLSLSQSSNIAGRGREEELSLPGLWCPGKWEHCDQQSPGLHRLGEMASLKADNLHLFTQHVMKFRDILLLIHNFKVETGGAGF